MTEPSNSSAAAMSSGRTALIVIGPTAVLAAVGLGPLVVWRSRLPDRLASHWGISGGPDGSMGYGAVVAMALGSVVATAAVMAWIAVEQRRRRPRDPMVHASVGLTVLLVAGILCGATASIAVANRDVGDWRSAGPLPGWHIVAVLALALVLTGATARVLPWRSRAGEAPAHQPVAAPLADGEQVVWVETLMVPWMLVPSLLLAAAGAGIVFVGPTWGLGIVMLVVAIAVSALASIRVTVDRRGLEVAYGPFHWPRTRVASDQIAEAEVIDVLPRQWGGWGYRGSLRLMKRAAVVLRRGPGIRLQLRDGGEFAVTISRPEAGVELLNRLAATRSH